MEYNSDFEVRKATLEAMGVNPYVENGKTIPLVENLPVSIVFTDYGDAGKFTSIVYGNNATTMQEINSSPENIHSYEGEEAESAFSNAVQTYTSYKINKFSQSGLIPATELWNSVIDDSSFISVSTSSTYKISGEIVESYDEDEECTYKVFNFKYELASEDDIFNYTHSLRNLNSIYEVDLAILAATEGGGGGGGLTPVIVDTLPETGEAGKMYFVPSDVPGSSDNYKEYLWITREVERTTYIPGEETYGDMSADELYAIPKSSQNYVYYFESQGYIDNLTSTEAQTTLRLYGMDDFVMEKYEIDDNTSETTVWGENIGEGNVYYYEHEDDNFWYFRTVCPFIAECIYTATISTETVTEGAWECVGNADVNLEDYLSKEEANETYVKTVILQKLSMADRIPYYEEAVECWNTYRNIDAFASKYRFVYEKTAKEIQTTSEAYNTLFVKYSETLGKVLFYFAYGTGEETGLEVIKYRVYGLSSNGSFSRIKDENNQYIEGTFLTSNDSVAKISRLTQAEYDALEVKDDNTLYIITDAE